MGGDSDLVWREAGQWWEFEPYREVRRAVGSRKEDIREILSLGLMADPNQKEAREDHREEWNLRERKIRDEKVSAACGQLPPSYYERKAETAWGVITGAEKKVGIAGGGGYVPLHCLSGYSFGRSVMLTEEIVTLAAMGGCPAVAIADHFSLTGAMELVKACQRNGIRPLVGASLELETGGCLVLIARSKRGYVNLCRLISACHLGEPRGFPMVTWERLAAYAEDLLCLTGGDVGPLDRLLARRQYEEAMTLTERLVRIYGRGHVFLEVERSFLPWQHTVEAALIDLGDKLSLPLVAGGVVTHASRGHFPAQDVLVCVDTLCLIDEVVGRKERRDPHQPQLPHAPVRSLNAERFLKNSNQIQALFGDHPEWILNTHLVAAQCDDDVTPARTCLPQVFGDDSHALREIVNLNAHGVYPQVTPKIRKRLDMEVNRINTLGFASHFLVAYDMVRWAGEHAIQFSGRGSVVDSAVAFVLGLSRIDAIQHNLHFDRFLPADGNKRPDIDIDFEARRRDEIRGYLTQKYGQSRVATVAAVGAFCSRGIVREVGKVFGLPTETIGFLAKKLHGSVSPDEIASALERRPELKGHNIPKERFKWVIRLAERLQDVPRNMRSHSSGIIISAVPITDTVPVQWSAAPGALSALKNTTHFEEAEPFLRIIQWDKRSAKHCFDKFDVLCLRGQDVLSRIEEQVRVTSQNFNVQQVRLDEEETYRAFRSGELIGIPQSASPAMRQAHIRIETQDLTDASLVQAGIRPGVGGAVKINELIARRRGQKEYSFAHPKLEEILGHTYGIIVFQEQVDQLLQEFCGCSGGEAEDIRDAIHKRRREDYGVMIKEKIIERILANGHSPTLAEQVFDYVAGFKGYGFAQGHALAFAEISVRCVHLMQNHPAEYFAALLSSQPAGYYGPCTISNEARSRGVKILGPCVNASAKDFIVEDVSENGLKVLSGGIRTGLMQVHSLSAGTREAILREQERVAMPKESREFALMPRVEYRPARRATAVAAVPDAEPPSQAFTSLFDFVAKVNPNRDELEFLILCGALDGLCPHRRAMLWAIPDAFEYAKTLSGDGKNPMLPMLIPEPPINLDMVDFDVEERAAYERAILAMDVERHLMAFERKHIGDRAITVEEARRLKPGQRAVVVGNPIRLRFPPTPSGKRVVFFDLEDETGLLNVTAFDRVYQLDGKAIVTSPYVTLIGHAQDRDGHTAFLASRVFPYHPNLLRGRVRTLPVRHGDFLMNGAGVPRLS